MAKRHHTKKWYEPLPRRDRTSDTILCRNYACKPFHNWIIEFKTVKKKKRITTTYKIFFEVLRFLSRNYEKVSSIGWVDLRISLKISDHKQINRQTTYFFKIRINRNQNPKSPSLACNTNFGMCPPARPPPEGNICHWGKNAFQKEGGEKWNYLLIWGQPKVLKIVVEEEFAFFMCIWKQ